MIHGNVQGIRASLLEEMDALYTLELDEDMFAPPELVERMVRYSALLRREVSVYISRAGDVLDVTVGVLDSVPLPEVRLRRSLQRLCGVRCLHTHPNSSPELSDVDLQALVSLKLDAMAAIGMQEDRATGMQAAFLGARVQGIPQPEETGIVAMSQIPQEAWMHRIEESDRLLADTAQELPENRPERAMLVGIESMASLEELRSLAETAGAEVAGRLPAAPRKAGQRHLYRQRQGGGPFAGHSGPSLRHGDCGRRTQRRADSQSGESLRRQGHRQNHADSGYFRPARPVACGKTAGGDGAAELSAAAADWRRRVAVAPGGGIGTRGPGETKLEISRRRIRRRLNDLRAEVEELSRQRAVQRTRRKKSELPVVALVGYTNTGKSSLLNRLSGADVLAKDMLFATLDPVMRRVELPEGGAFLLVDTVGFIRKLPHTLVDAFRSTLEEVVQADLLLMVSDASEEALDQQRQVVCSVLSDLGAGEKPCIDVLNKTDCAREDAMLPGAVRVSARTGEGMDALLQEIARRLFASQRTVRLRIPYTNGSLLSWLHDNATVLEEAYEADATHVTVRLDRARLDRIAAEPGTEVLAP